MFDLLRKNFDKYIALTDAEFALCRSLFRYRKFKKHQYILQEGDVCRCETFIVCGCTRTFETDEKGQEHILQFGVETWWVGDLYSLLSGSVAD
jgi:CRP-like cAMP-binding protein